MTYSLSSDHLNSLPKEETMPGIAPNTVINYDLAENGLVKEKADDIGEAWKSIPLTSLDTLDTTPAVETGVQKTKFLKLGARTLKTLNFFALLGIWGCAAYNTAKILDAYVPDSWENKIFASSLSPKEEKIKTQLENSQKLATQLFELTPQAELANRINLKLRLNSLYALTQHIPGRDRYISIPLFNSINLPVSKFIKEENQAIDYRKKEAEILQNAQNLDTEKLQEVKLTLWEEPQNNPLSLFLNFAAKDAPLVYDYVFFHEYTHVILKKEIEKQNKELSTEWKKDYGIVLQSAQLQSLEESVADNLSLIINIKKYDMDKTQAIAFFDSVIQSRFTESIVLKSLNSAKVDNENTHNSLASLHFLKQNYLENPEAFKSMPVSQAVSQSLEFAEQSLYYSVYQSDLYTEAQKTKLKDGLKTKDAALDLDVWLKEIKSEIVPVGRKAASLRVFN